MSSWIAVLGLLGTGCGEDPKPTHVEGSYTAGEVGGAQRDFNVNGDNGGGNSTDQSGDWDKVYVRCTVSSLSGGAKSVTGFVSDQPLSSADDAGRTGFEILSSVIVDSVTDPYLIKLWYPPADFTVDYRDPVEGQAVCDTYQVTILGSDSFQVIFDCPDMRTTFENIDPHFTELGNLTFTHCD